MKKIRVLLLTTLAILLALALVACDNSKTEETAGTPANTTVETNETVGNETEGSEKETEKVTESEKVTETETVIQTETQTETQTEPHTHAFSEWKTVKASTCTAEGEQERTCNCGVKETQGLDMLAHTEVIDNAVEATCTETGLTEGLRCEICKTVLVQQKTVAVIDHIESDWIIDNEATKTEDGKKHTECTMCKKVMKEEIAYAAGSLGLAYTVNEDGTTCTITGMGTCTDTEVFIPGMIDNYKVTAIADKAFAEVSGVTKIVLLNGVQTIGTRAFYSCADLTEITIPESVTDIGTHIFYKCDKLITVYYNSSYGNYENPFLNIDSIKKVVFGGNSVLSGLPSCANIKEVVITDSVTSIGRGAFSYCTNLTSITIPDSVTNIGDSAFQGCSSLTNITIPDSVTSIGNDAFRGCSGLTSIIIPDSVTSIGSSAFQGCSSLTSIIIPDSVTSTGSHTFSDCYSLTSVTVGKGVTRIETSTFARCINLTSIIIPDSVTRFGDVPFLGCLSLDTVYYMGTEEQWEMIINYRANGTLANSNIIYNYKP